MGIIILPFLLGALVLGIISIVKTIKQLRTKQTGTKELLLGLITSSTIFGLICLSYIIEGRAWKLSPAFRIPIFMVFIPFIVQISTEKSKNSKMAYISKIILISISMTAIFGVVFNDLFFDLIDYLGIEKHY
jgi:hypothetical protein